MTFNTFNLLSTKVESRSSVNNDAKIASETEAKASALKPKSFTTNITTLELYVHINHIFFSVTVLEGFGRGNSHNEIVVFE
jgi:hypothetical protein